MSNGRGIRHAVLLQTPSGFIDYDLELLADLMHVIDDQLDRIVRQSTRVDDPDAMGYFDRAEHITGLGFVACQAHMASTYGFLHVSKPVALARGPRHSCGRTVAELVNHAANYWKHNSEWPLGKNDSRRAKIIAAFEAIGFPVGVDYPLSGVLTELTAPHAASFGPIVTALESWRNDVQTAA
jgi:hypothetical protein